MPPRTHLGGSDRGGPLPAARRRQLASSPCKSGRPSRVLGDHSVSPRADPHLVVLAATLAARAIGCGESSLPSAPGDHPTTAITATAAFQVNSIADVVDAAPGNGVCRTAAALHTPCGPSRKAMR